MHAILIAIAKTWKFENSIWEPSAEGPSPPESHFTIVAKLCADDNKALFFDRHASSMIMETEYILAFINWIVVISPVDSVPLRHKVTM